MLVFYSSVVGLFLRLWLLQMPHLLSWLETRPEITTPATSWQRLTEGAAVSNISADYFESDAYHGSSLMLWTLSFVEKSSPHFLNALFIVADLLTALSLRGFSRKFLDNEYNAQESSKDGLAKGIESILLKYNFNVMRIPDFVFSLYFVNPITAATCVSKCTLVFTNMFLSLFLLSAVSGSIMRTTMFLALSTYETLYPLQMVLGAGICCWKYQKNSRSSPSSCIFKTLMYFSLWLACLFTVSYLFQPHPSALISHFKFILRAPDQRPNVGVFWYFFTEVFDHFHTFFMCVFQINVVVYSIPLTIKFRSHPVFLLYLLICITAIFKSYPSWGDAALWLSLLPVWSHTFGYLRHPTVTSVMLLASTILCPVMWQMWIDAHSANANFYFAATLAYTTALVLITADIAMAYLHWHQRIRDGLKAFMPETNEKAIYRLLN